MSSGSAAVYVLDSDDDDGAKNRNISELISALRTAYRTKDFDRVEEILVAREAKSKREIENMKKENALLYGQCELGKQDRISLEDELSKQKGENKELKRLVVLEKDARDAAQEGERKAEERYEKLLEKVKIGGRHDDTSVIFELKKKCCELECAKVKAESEVELWKRRFEELDIRVSKLDEDTAMLMDMGRQVSKKCDDNASGNEEKGSSGKGRVENGNNTVNVNIQDNGFDCDGNTRIAAGAGLNSHSPTKGDEDLQSAAGTRSALRAVVYIIDSDDDHAPGRILCEKEMTSQDFADKVHSGLTAVANGTRMLKRKHASCVNVSENMNGDDHEGDGDIRPTSKRKMKQQQELIHDTDGSLANHCSATAVSSGIQNVDKLISSSTQDVSRNMNAGNHEEREGNITPTSRRDMKQQEESVRDTDGSPANRFSATAVSSGYKNVDKLTISSRQDPVILRRCEEKMGTVKTSRSFMHEFVLDEDSDDSSSSLVCDDEFRSQIITKVQRKSRV